MNNPEIFTLGVFAAVGALAAALVRFLGWHWLAVWPVFLFSFGGLIFVAVFLSRGAAAFVAGFRRGFNGGRRK